MTLSFIQSQFLSPAFHRSNKTFVSKNKNPQFFVQEDSAASRKHFAAS